MNELIQDSKVTSFVEFLPKTKLPFNNELLVKASKVLKSIDFPTTRTEAWKYTRLGRITSISFNEHVARVGKNLSREFINANYQISSTGLTFVFENGIFRSDLSSGEFPKGATIKPLTGCTKDELATIGQSIELENELFNSMNTVYAIDGMSIVVEDNTVIDEPIQLIHLLTGKNTVANLRNFIRIGKFAKAEIMQSFFALDAENSFANSITEINVSENSHLTINKMQCEDEGNFHISTEQVDQSKDSTFTINTMTLDGTLVRNNLNISVNGINATTNLNGAYILNRQQHVDNHTCVDHKAPHCNSNELYKGVIDDKATAVFNGKVFVRKDAQKINAFQSNANVLLSDLSTVNSKPELEIYADDVKCSHGSTTGQLDEEAVFYLRARGISERSARNLMVEAFIGQVLDKIENEDFLKFTQEKLNTRFNWESIVE
jgi:Fe-S cluster assembly protein SufD